MTSNNGTMTRKNRWSDGTTNHTADEQSQASPPPTKPFRRASNGGSGGGVVISRTDDSVSSLGSFSAADSVNSFGRSFIPNNRPTVRGDTSRVDIKRTTMVDGNPNKSRIRWLATTSIGSSCRGDRPLGVAMKRRMSPAA